MSKRIFLIRHGYSLHNQLYPKMGMSAFYDNEVIDSPLLNKGRDEAQELRNKESIYQYMTSKVELVLVSPLVRALETASIIFKDSNIPIVCHEFLREYPNGKQICNQRSEIVSRIKEYPHINFENIVSNKDIYWNEDRHETLDELNKRIEITKKYLFNRPEQTIAIVGHGSFIGQFKDNHIRYLENGEEELKHCYPYEYILKQQQTKSASV